MLTTVYDDYIIEQPGIHFKVQNFKQLVSQVDEELYDHLQSHGVEFLLFSFRWMHNMLIRELPLDATIRLWDTYLSEEYGFSQFHIYVCCAFLRQWSKRLLRENDFSSIIMLLQNLPAQNWGERQISELTADAFSLMQSLNGSNVKYQNQPIGLISAMSIKHLFGQEIPDLDN
ncbi:rab-GTPase-TBC domain-containing protein [Ditylenchus destructor]|nr:rab-GTPase-TBC domain-containing protein [Ditylenchus destructor]